MPPDTIVPFRDGTVPAVYTRPFAAAPPATSISMSCSAVVSAHTQDASLRSKVCHGLYALSFMHWACNNRAEECKKSSEEAGDGEHGCIMVLIVWKEFESETDVQLRY